MKSDPIPDPIPDYNQYRTKAPRGALVALAAKVVRLTRCEGAPAAAEYFSGLLRTRITPKMVKGVCAKVATGEIPVTREELEKAAKQYPVLAASIQRKPDGKDQTHN
jgi:hypothetical protein